MVLDSNSDTIKRVQTKISLYQFELERNFFRTHELTHGKEGLFFVRFDVVHGALGRESMLQSILRDVS